MENPQIGDLVVLTAGSMRMAVEAVDGDNVSCLWCHEGKIGRDTFNARMLKKWEFREEDRGPRPAAGEVMVSITGLEFSYTQAPPKMKSVVM